MQASRSNDSVYATCATAPIRRTIYFTSMTLEELRALAKWPDGTKKQILAWCHNRYPCGFMYVFEENPSVSF